MPSSASSDSARKKTPERRDHGWRMCLTIVLRAIVGAVFIVSGWAKLIDPWGFVIKTGEYLSVWGWNMPHEIILTGCVGLSTFEFLAGLFIASGCFRRVGVWMACAMMLGLLPLSLYIAVAAPVTDCGCFGDLFHVSNWMTFLKNVAICGALVWLLLYNRRVMAFFPFSVQWLVAAGGGCYALWISFMGYNVQPLADFRPYRTGTVIFEGSREYREPEYIYEKDGELRSFALDSLPDESWTFVEMENGDTDVPQIAVRDAEGEIVNEYIVDSDHYQLWLIVNAPGIQSLSRAHFLHSLNRNLAEDESSLIAVVAGSGRDAARWQQLIRPEFDVYYAEDTALEQLVRGTSALILTDGGTIVWKRTMSSVDSELADSPGAFAGLLDLPAPDDGRMLWQATALLLLVFLCAGILGYRRLIFHTLPSETSRKDDDKADGEHR